MLKKQATLLFALVLTLLLTAVFAHQAPAQTKALKEARWEGRVIRMDKASSSLTVRKVGGTLEKTCVYDSSTTWVSQYNADKKINDIDFFYKQKTAYEICRGSAEKAG